MASVSVDRRGEKWRLRWREPVTADGVTKQRQRTLTVSTNEAAIELRAVILRALEVEGHYAPTPAPEPEPEVQPLAGDLEAAAAASLRHQAAWYVEGTRRKYASTLNRLFRDIRAESALGASDRVPVSVLSRDPFSRVLLRWRRDGLSESTQYTASRIALDVWRWATDEPELYPGTPTPPRVSSRVLATTISSG